MIDIPWKKIISVAFLTVNTLLVAEILLRVTSSFVDIYDIEMMTYAQELKTRSSVPGVFHEHRSNVSARLMGVEVALNSLGHRSRELAVPKAVGEKRVHFIGSSILLGWGVEEKNGLVARVEQRLNDEVSSGTGYRYTTINAGIGNYNTFYEVELFEHQVDRTDPDAVVLQYYINDAEPNPDGRDNPLFKNSVLAAFTYLRLKSMLLVGTGTLAEHYRSLYRDGQPDWERTKKALRKLKRLCDQRGIPLVVLLVPEIHDFSANGSYPPIYEILDRTFAAMGVEMINPLAAMRERFGDSASAAWIAKDDPHPSAEAHEVMADAVYRHLSKIRM